MKKKSLSAAIVLIALITAAASLVGCADLRRPNPINIYTFRQHAIDNGFELSEDQGWTVAYITGRSHAEVRQFGSVGNARTAFDSHARWMDINFGGGSSTEVNAGHQIYRRRSGNRRASLYRVNDTVFFVYGHTGDDSLINAFVNAVITR